MNKYRKQSRVAQRRRKREKMCDRKVAFNTREDAMIKGADVYKCQHCGRWHRTAAFHTLVNIVKKKGKK